MNEMVTLREEQAEKILQTVINEKTPAIMSYSSRGKWHVAKVLLINIDGDQLYIQSTHSAQKQHPINIQIDQPVGISFKHEYGKFVFDTIVMGLEPSTGTNSNRGGIIVLKTGIQETVFCTSKHRKKSKSFKEEVIFVSRYRKH